MMEDHVASQSLDQRIRSTCEACGDVQESEQQRTQHLEATGHRQFRLDPRGRAYFVRTG